MEASQVRRALNAARSTACELGLHVNDAVVIHNYDAGAVAFWGDGTQRIEVIDTALRYAASRVQRFDPLPAVRPNASGPSTPTGCSSNARTTSPFRCASGVPIFSLPVVECAHACSTREVRDANPCSRRAARPA